MAKKKKKKIVRAHGPYTRKSDGRKYMNVFFEDGSHSTRSYPKWLMEQKLGRELHPREETIDHIDRDFTNDDFDNLRIVPMSKHTKEDHVRVKMVRIVCVLCGKKALKNPRHLNHNANMKKAGPFCSKKCAGKYSAEVQHGKRKPLPPQPPIPVRERTYYMPKKNLEE